MFKTIEIYNILKFICYIYVLNSSITSEVVEEEGLTNLVPELSVGGHRLDLKIY